MTEITYTPEQNAVISADTYASMLIVAGAGSGKTFTMTQRIIALIKQGVSPEKILGLTFTKAAATELLTRVSSQVYAHRAHTRQDEETDADSAFLKPEVYTYDAFFQSIVRQFGLLVGMDPQTVPLSEAGTYQLIDSVIQEHIREALTAIEDAETTDLDDDTEDIGSYGTFVSEVLSLSDAISASMIDSDCTSIDEAVERVESWDSAFIEHINGIIDNEYPAEKDLPNFGEKVKLSGAKTERGFQKWIDEKSRDYLAYLLVDLRKNTSRRSLLLKYVKLFHQKKQELHVAQFADFTIAAMQLVERFPWIGQYYRSRFTHVFLDEYQDSSTVQANLIARLFAPQGVHAPSASALTAVGDPYQAIYAWRGAAPGAFVNFLRATQAPSPLSLSASMRNPLIVLDMANMLTNPLRIGHKDVYNREGSIALHEVDVKKLSVFTPQSAKSAEPSSMETAEPYSAKSAETRAESQESQRAESQASHSATQTPQHTKNVDSERRQTSEHQGSFAALIYHTKRQEIDGVVRYAKAAIERSKSENNQRIARGQKAQAGPYVAVLMRAKTHMAQYAQALTEAGLTVQVDGINSVLDRPDAQDMLYVLNCVSNHAESTALVNLLASTRYALTTEDLQSLSRAASAYNTSISERLAAHVGLHQQEVSSRNHDTPVIMTLVDVLLSDNLSWILDTHFHGSERARTRVSQCAAMLRKVEAAQNMGVEKCIRVAGEELGLDIDIAVAYATSRAKKLTKEAAALSSIDTLVDLAHTYADELIDGQSESLSGFLAWLHNQKGSALPKNPTIIGSDNADVIVCTIHHAKGLEWDSVIIPSMEQNSFPSSQGSGLKIEQALPEGPVPFGQYDASAKTWFSDPSAVPNPVRSDKDAVSRFADATEFNQFIPNAAVLEKLVYNQIRLPKREKLSEKMSIREESAQTVLEDERRLAYVALTRAKRDAIMLGYVEKESDALDAFAPVRFTPQGQGDPKTQQNIENMNGISIFLAECHEYLASETLGDEQWRDTKIEASSLAQNFEFDNTPYGFFVGDLADYYAHETVYNALEAACSAQQRTEGELYMHPRMLNSAIGQTLERTKQAVEQHTHTRSLDDAGEQTNAHAEQHKSATSLLDTAVRVHETISTLGYVHSAQVEATGNQQNAHNKPSSDDQLIAQAKRIQLSRNTSVTAVQRELGEQSNTSSAFQQLQRARAIMRPVPSRAVYESNAQLSPATLGTVFHAFAQRYFTPERERDDDFAQLRASMCEEVATEQPDSALDKQMHDWKQRLISSAFDPQDCVGTEVPFAYAVRSTGQTVVGIIDAVFAGQVLDDSPISQHTRENNTTISYTIIDWKTGHKPLTAQERDEKLLQIDMYREIWATLRGISVDQVDAALYYVSEADESNRVLYAHYKSAQQIEELFQTQVDNKADNKADNKTVSQYD